jgi:hypothetical protein
MEMFQNGIAEGLPEMIRRDQREKGVSVISCQQPAKEVGTVNMSGFLDIAAEKSGELIRIYIRIPVYCRQFFIHFRNFDALVKSQDIGKVGQRPNSLDLFWDYIERCEEKQRVILGQHTLDGHFKEQGFICLPA